MSAAAPWRAHIAEIRRRVGERRPFSMAAPIEEAVVGSSRVADEPVRAECVLESVSGGITAVGTAHARWISECRRCLEPLGGDLDVDLDETFEDHPTPGETYPIEGDAVDLGAMVREALLLALPLAPVCAEDCAGPAPEAFPVTVESDEPPVDLRWAALDALRDQ